MANKARTYPDIRIPSPVTQTWLAYKENPIAMAALWGMLCLLLVVVLGPSMVTYDPQQQDPNALLLPPSWTTSGTLAHFLGTDDLGRDLLSRLVHGARLTFGSAVVATLIAMLCGGTIGVLGGMSQGLKSSVLHHMLDTLLSVPSLLLAIVLVAVLGPGLDNAVLAVTLSLTPQFIRAIYHAVNNELQKEYIVAVRLDGSPPLRILRLAILPNIVDTVVAQTTRALCTAILDISAICFLGIGAQSPSPEWGTMLADGMDLMYIGAWTVTLPGFAIIFSVLITNLVGDGLRSAIQKGID
ncbi:MAG: ABC transporter permease subunit [Aeromonadaceae bacterium]|nr:ABC transporter permease subunit [Aeromonadaceae bacterium]MBP8065127.1 ABC transporter permease subunit [Aeromonadaceae bacterium]MBP9568595.1 ABC transporter permease subunit [Aeromonadaceae bacterium]